MKHFIAFLLATILGFFTTIGAGAQAPETIWMESSQQTFHTGDTITITLNASSATPIQGFNFQLSYDPACLQPLTPTSQVSGLNYLSVPQTAGLVDGIFASNTPVKVNGALATVQFKALAGCQTELTLVNASLAVLDASRLAVPLQGISLGVSSLSFNSEGSAAPTPQPASTGEVNPTAQPNSNQTVTPEANPTQVSPEIAGNPLDGLFLPIVIAVVLILLVVLVIRFGLFSKTNRTSNVISSAGAPKAMSVVIRRGPQAGTVLPLVRFPCRIGSNPANEIWLNDGHISPLHAEIFADQSGFSLVDMGSQEGTYLNGKLIQGQQARLKAGDVLRLGGILLVFGPG